MIGRATLYHSDFMMTQSEYKLFDGVVDFTVLFTHKTSDSGAMKEEVRREPTLRPIVKTNHHVDRTNHHVDQTNHHVDRTSIFTDTTNTTATVTATGVIQPSKDDTLNCRAGSPVMPGAGGRRPRSLSGSSGGSDGGSTVYCVFCKRNRETREFFTTHTLKDWRGVIICPVLRAYKCPKCGATGDTAHTESHCPRSDNLPSLMASLRTRRSSCGIRTKYAYCGARN